MKVAIPTWRGSRGIAVGFLGALAVTVACSYPANARHHPSHATSHKESSGAGPPYAAIVVDANSGAVLHAANPDELRHPASLTKIMTLYLLFERLEAGKIKLDTPLAVSEHAAVQAPTKLGLKPGQSLEVEDAIRALVTKSANDAAVVIAEALGGTEQDFAEMMTRKAHALGMSRTFYRNASGLPDGEQVTTARDMALLGRAIQERFPHEYRYFSTPSFTYHGMAMRNHNHLLGQVEGLDGIKTGYTQASGFNLVTSVRRNNRHIVAVVLGGASAGSRDARMRSLIEEYIVAAPTQKSVTAVAEGTSARDLQSADLHATERRSGVRAEPAPVNDIGNERSTDVRTGRAGGAADTRAADTRAGESHSSGRAAPTYSVASFSGPIPRPAPSARAPAFAADPIQTATVAPQAHQAPKPAKPTAANEPIKPIQVKTVKVTLPAGQIAALAPPLVVPTAEASSATPAPQDAMPQDRAPRAPTEPVAVAAPRMPAARTVPALAPAPRLAQAPPLAEAQPLAAAVAEPKSELSRDVQREPQQGEPAPAATLAAAAVGTPPQGARTQNAPAVPLPPLPPHRAAAISSMPNAAHSGWIIQVGALDSEREARQRLSAVQAKAGRILGHADPFTEPVVKGDKTLYRARFAGLQKDQKDEAEAICRQLKRNDIDCMIVRN